MCPAENIRDTYLDDDRAGRPDRHAPHPTGTPRLFLETVSIRRRMCTMKTTKTLRLHTRMLRENRNGHGATDARSVQARASKEHVPCAEAVNHAAACGTRAESARQRLGQKHHALGANALNAASKADALLHPPLSSDARAQRPLRRCRSRAPCSWQPRERRKPR